MKLRKYSIREDKLLLIVMLHFAPSGKLLLDGERRKEESKVTNLWCYVIPFRKRARARPSQTFLLLGAKRCYNFP